MSDKMKKLLKDDHFSDAMQVQPGATINFPVPSGDGRTWIMSPIVCPVVAPAAMATNMPKHAVGDTVRVKDRHGIVYEVHETTNYWQPDVQLHEYSIRFDNGAVERYTEHILEILGSKPLMCECGSWAVPWNVGFHSAWCPANTR